MDTEEFDEQQSDALRTLWQIADDQKAAAVKYQTEPLPVVRHRRRRRFLPSLSTAVISAVLLLVVGLLLAWADIGGAPGQDPTSVRLYRWPDNQMPVGITLSSMQAYVMTDRVLRTVEHQEWSARYFWHANTVRLQLLQDRLVGTTGHHLARWYLRDIETVTNYGLAQGLTIVLNAQTELAMGYAHNESLPDAVTQQFWRTLSVVYGKNPHVVFDLFNEPRRCSWQAWQPAFQGLIDNLRAHGARNQLWVEGLSWGSTLQGMPLLHDPSPPKGYPGIVYTFHHPGAPWPWQAPVTSAEWDQAFGYLADQGVPVIDAEFANYTGSYDWAYPELLHANTRALVIQYLNYLASHHIGMMAWSLVPGALNSGLSFTSVAHEPQGDGQLVKAWLLAQNHHYTHSRYYARFLRRNSRDLRHRIIARYCTPYPLGGHIPARLQHYVKRCPR